ncbi:MAG TPA: homoserine O-acetyltransferase, partial [Cytophagales bacterium]|nr:homoserine O-acetyltransferase [Cytophagales bacterium]
TWCDPAPEAGRAGLMTARALGMLTYRNYETFVATQSNPEPVLEGHRAESYVAYQGQKLADRFHAYSYWILSLAMDGHHVGRERGTVKQVLSQVQVPALVIGISSDILCPPPEQRALAFMLPQGQFIKIDSPYGHDGFLLEYAQISKEIDRFLKG